MNKLGPGAGSDEQVNQPSDLMKGGQFLQYLSYYQIYKKDSILHSNNYLKAKFFTVFKDHTMKTCVGNLHVFLISTVRGS